MTLRAHQLDLRLESSWCEWRPWGESNSRFRFEKPANSAAVLQGQIHPPSPRASGVSKKRVRPKSRPSHPQNLRCKEGVESSQSRRLGVRWCGLERVPQPTQVSNITNEPSRALAALDGEDLLEARACACEQAQTSRNIAKAFHRAAHLPGIEPGYIGLTSRRNPRHARGTKIIKPLVARVRGLEPRSSASKAAILPLDDTRIALPGGIELPSSGYKAEVLPLN